MHYQEKLFSTNPHKKQQICCATTVFYLASLLVALIKAELAMHKAFVHISTYHPKLEESPG